MAAAPLQAPETTRTLTLICGFGSQNQFRSEPGVGDEEEEDRVFFVQSWVPNGSTGSCKLGFLGPVFVPCLCFRVSELGFR
jgi:hypothetical protein